MHASANAAAPAQIRPRTGEIASETGASAWYQSARVAPTSPDPPEGPADTPPPERRRRERYRGTHPRRFREKYKELAPERYPDAIERVLERGQTPAGQHVPILVDECLRAAQLDDASWLRSRADGAPRVADVTLGHGGHAEQILARIAPYAGTLLGLDQDPETLARTTARLERCLVERSEAAPSGAARLVTRRTNFAALQSVLPELGWTDGVDVVFADLGVSSMQIDDPARGFSFKLEGPLDMRMNPARGLSAADWLARVTRTELATSLREDADEPYADTVAAALCPDSRPRPTLRTTTALARAVRAALPAHLDDEAREQSVRRVFQAIRIAVNDELGVLDRLLAQLPAVLRPGGRAVFLTFHSGEDRRVKRAFERGLAAGVYSAHSDGVERASPEERRRNPRSSSAKLRWAERCGLEAL